MKLANPLYYPLAVLAGVIVLVLGVRVAGISHLVMLPAAAAIATGGASILKAREPESLGLTPELEQEFRSVQAQANSLADKVQVLREEAAKALTEASHMELLVAVEGACDRALELPAKLTQMARRMQGSDSLLSIDEMQQQLSQVQTKARHSSGIAKEQLDRLGESLQRNIQLAREGQDARQAQMVSLSTLISDTAGVLQKLQNQLRTANLNNSEDIQELVALNQDFQSFQESVDLLISQ